MHFWSYPVMFNIYTFICITKSSIVIRTWQVHDLKTNNKWTNKKLHHNLSTCATDAPFIHYINSSAFVPIHFKVIFTRSVPVFLLLRCRLYLALPCYFVKLGQNHWSEMPASIKNINWLPIIAENTATGHLRKIGLQPTTMLKYPFHASTPIIWSSVPAADFTKH